MNVCFFQNNLNFHSMNKLTFIEQQQSDEVLNLEIAYSNLYQAYISKNKEKMYNAINFAVEKNPHHATTIQLGIVDVFNSGALFAFGFEHGNVPFLVISIWLWKKEI